MNGNLFAGREPVAFAGLRGLERALDELFGDWPTSALRSAGPGTYPAVNVGVTPDALHVFVLAPGLDASKLDVNVQDGALTIAGARAGDDVDNDETRHYRRERFRGEFRRVIALPKDVNAEEVEASYRDGVLKVTVPRRESARARQIQVK